MYKDLVNLEQKKNQILSRGRNAKSFKNINEVLIPLYLTSLLNLRWIKHREFGNESSKHEHANQN